MLNSKVSLAILYIFFARQQHDSVGGTLALPEARDMV